MSWEDYGKLFDQLLPEVVRAHDPERDYWPSSAHSPRGDRALANSPGSGDAHLWDVWHGRQPFEWYRASQHRFVSEFGFQSFPEPRTVQSYTLAQDRNITSYVMELHQRSGIGNTVILQYMLDWFRLPTSFEMTLWLSQILQGIGIKIGVEHWRRNMPRTMGTLYWQLNDCWPVASWSSVDYHGRWKALHYMARRFYAPILISAIADASSGNVEIFLTNDTRQTQHGTVSWSLTRPDGTELASDHADASIDAFHSTPIKVLNLRNYLVQYGSRDLLLWLNYRQGNQTVSEDCVLFAPPKHLELPEPDIAAQVELNGENEFLIRLTSRRPALWVWIVLDGIDAHFSDNFFHLRPGEPKAIRVTTWQSANLESMRDGLRVYSLFDTYQ